MLAAETRVTLIFSGPFYEKASFVKCFFEVFWIDRVSGFVKEKSLGAMLLSAL